MKVLVTGATGFLGLHLCSRLIAEGYQVIGIGRNHEHGAIISGMGAEFFKADLRDMKALRMAFKGVDSVVHAGAFSSPWGQAKEFNAINVEGTRNTLDCAIEQNMKRFVYISTSSVYFNFQDRFNIQETDPITPNPPCNYTKSKLLAEEEVQKYIQAGLPAIILRPRGIFGPGDTAIVPRILNAHKKGRLPIIGNGRNKVDLTYIDNVVEACVCALQSSVHSLGEIYNISNGEPVILWDFIAQMFAELEISFRGKKAPYPMIYWYSYASEGMGKLLGFEPSLTRYTASLLAKSQTLDISKARRLLGYKPIVSLEEGLQRFIKWYKAEQIYA